jgi:hypothetical protein
MNKPMTNNEMKDWEAKTWDRCQKQAWSDMSISEKVRVRIMQEAYDCADRGEVEAYNSVKVMCSEVLALLDLAVAAEREACAKVCEAEAEKWEGKDGPVCFEVRLCSDAIRARGEK